MSRIAYRTVMKRSAFLVVVCLAACEDLNAKGMGSDDPGMDPMDHPGSDPDDPRDDPFLADINNAWVSTMAHFNFQGWPAGKNSSEVIGGNGGVSPYGDDFVLEGVFYDHMVHFTATKGPLVLTLDGTFVDVATMHLVVRETQTHLVLGCTTNNDICR